MITGITGLPGDGKTNLAVSLVKARAEKENRPVYYNAAPNDDPEQGGMVILDKVALPWIPIDPLEWFNAPQGAIIFIDECQHYFAPRKRGDKQPEFATRLENHRKAGHDIYLITQHPSLIDVHERKLVDQHIHTIRKFQSGWVTRYTWKGMRDQPQLAATRKDATEAQAVFNKDAFKWYLSTKQDTAKVKIPAKVMLLVALIIGLPLGGWYWLHKQEQRFKPSDSAAVQGNAGGSGGKTDSSSSRKLTTAEYLAAHQPRVAGLAYTAPVYDDVTKPAEAPYPAACVAMGERCGCYTQQGTKLDTPADLCRSIVAGGFYVAWQTKEPQAQFRQPRVAGQLVEAAPGQAVALDGTSGVRMAATPSMPLPPVDQGSGRGGALPRLPQPSVAVQ